MAKYKAKSKRIKGWLNIEFGDDGLLKAFINRIKDVLSPAQVVALQGAIPRHQDELMLLTKIGFAIEAADVMDEASDEVADSRKPNPVAIWCAAYNQHHATTYQVSKAEIGILNNNFMLVKPEYLDVYMKSGEWWCQVKSVGNYIKNINQVRELAAVAANKGEVTVSEELKAKRFKITSRMLEVQGTGSRHKKDAEMWQKDFEQTKDPKFAQWVAEAKKGYEECGREYRELEAELKKLG